MADHAFLCALYWPNKSAGRRTSHQSNLTHDSISFRTRDIADNPAKAELNREGGGIAALGFALLLTTLSALLLELSLTRLFSVVLFYHYAFLAISLAVLGLASGGIIARRLPRDMTPRKHRALMSKVCMAACVALIPALQFTLDTNVWLVTTAEAASRLVMLFLIFLVPFALAGFVIASTLATGSRRIASLYFYDLLGGSLGCLLFVPVMSFLGGPNTVLFAGLLWAVTAVVWAAGSRSRSLIIVSLVLAVGMSALVSLNHDGRIFDVRYTRGKPVDGELYTAWNTFSRVSVRKYEDNDDLWILIDGGAGTVLSDLDPDGEKVAALRSNLGSTGPEVAFWLARPERSLVIGSGGGFDVIRALAAGSKKTTAVEINPLIASDVMRGEFEEYSRGLYTRPDVEVHVEDGRSFVRRTEERYDVIQLSQVDTWASSASGSYTLAEGYLYTVEALEDYLARLTDAGLLSVTRWEFKRPRETLRLAAVALAALERRGASRPADHLMVILENLDSKGMTRMGTVIVGRTPFSATQVEAARERVAQAGMTLTFAPGITNADPLFEELINASSREEFFARYAFNVTPVYDDSPFFFFMGRWANTFTDVFSFDPSGDSLNTGAQFLLVTVLILALAAVFLFLFLPLILRRRRLPTGPSVAPYLGFCVAVGLAYIVVEIALIHRFIVFLGQPVYSLTVVIFTFLLSSSLGSRLSELIPEERLSRRAQLILVGIVALLVLYVILLPWMTRLMQPQPAAVKVLIVAGTVFPLGFLMGMPFPSALRLAAATRQHLIEWLWAVNAAATVLGSVLAIFVFVILGITWATALGGLAYAACVGFLAFMKFAPAEERHVYDRAGPAPA